MMPGALSGKGSAACSRLRANCNLKFTTRIIMIQLPRPLRLRSQLRHAHCRAHPAACCALPGTSAVLTAPFLLPFPGGTSVPESADGATPYLMTAP